MDVEVGLVCTGTQLMGSLGRSEFVILYEAESWQNVIKSMMHLLV